MQKNPLHVFTSPLFLVCLLLLICNDWIWKAEYGNFWTGKISDFAGLAIFPLFWGAFFPRFKKHIFILTAIVFIWWKSPYSQFFIEEWNSLGIFSLTRVVDYSDLWALLVLPFAYRYRGRSLLNQFPFSVPKMAVKPLTFFIIGLSSLAFIATSMPVDTKQMEIVYNKNYEFDYSKEELQNRIFDLYQHYRISVRDALPETTRYGNFTYIDKEKEDFIHTFLQDTTYLQFNTSKLIPILMLPDTDSHVVQVILEGNDEKSSMNLVFLADYRSPPVNKSKEFYSKKLLKKFEKRVVKKLRKP